MIGLPLTALVLSCLLVWSPPLLIILAELAARRVLRAKSRRSAILGFLRVRPWLEGAIVVASIVLVALITPLQFRALLESTIRTGAGATYDEAAVGDLHALPKCARDINYYSILMGASADLRL